MNHQETCHSDFHRSVLDNPTEWVHVLLQNNNVNEKDMHGATPLHYACKEGWLEIVDLLLDFHADVNTKSNDGSTALHIAAKLGQTEILKLLFTQ